MINTSEILIITNTDAINLLQTPDGTIFINDNYKKEFESICQSDNDNDNN